MVTISIARNHCKRQRPKQLDSKITKHNKKEGGTRMALILTSISLFSIIMITTTMLYDVMTVTIMNIFLLVSITGTITLIIYQIHEDISKKKESFDIRHAISGALVFVLALFLIFHIKYIDTAKAHGMTDEMMSEITTLTMARHINETPIESTLPDDINELEDSIIIYYRFDCPSCATIYSDLEKIVTTQLENYPDSEIYWVSTRSKQGEELLTSYPVNEVPSAVYVHNEEDKGYTVKELTQTDNQNNESLNIENINRLFELQNEE